MDVSKEIMIDDDVVSEFAKMEGYVIYKYESKDGSNIILYFTKGDKVKYKLYLDSDCNQNYGFISECIFNKIQ